MKIEVMRYKQKDKEILMFFADPNYVKRLVKISDISVSNRNFQRPYDENRVHEIKNYVLGRDKLYKKGKDVFAKGYIPNAIVLNLSPKFSLDQAGNRVFIHFPEEKDIGQYKESIEVIDGQHRLLAFDDECKSQLDGQKYQMCFVAFINLSDDEKKEIFMVLNERQKTVDKNILLRHKRLLNLLLDEEETRYDVISRLNAESDSPFHRRIIMAGEKIPYGLKAAQIDDALSSSKALEKLIDSKDQIGDKNYRVLRNYFTAWHDTFKLVWFTKGSTLTKMAGFRFMCYLFPFIFDILRSTGKGRDFQVAAFSKITREIRDSYFNAQFDIRKAQKAQFFQERRGTIRLATQIGRELSEQHQDREDDILV